jgi:elongation factor Ts
MGVITELNCETDFAAGNEMFKNLMASSIQHIKGSSCADVQGLLNDNSTGRTLNDDFVDAIGAIRENIRLARFEKYVGSPHSYLCSYVHAGGKFAAMLELSCPDTTVFNKSDFKSVAGDLALQITALSPRYVRREDVSAAEIERELRIEMSKADIAAKPEHLRAKIANGRVDKTLSAMVLLEQSFVKDPSKTVGEVLSELSVATGAQITVERFTRYALGEHSSN